MGPGTLLGLAWGQRLNDRDYELERARLVRELPKAEEAAMCKRAIKDSAKAVLNAIVGELANEESGAGARSLSAPGNVAVRNMAFADTADGQLKRLSGGRLQFDELVLQRVRQSPRELVKALGEPSLQLRLGRKAR